MDTENKFKEEINKAAQEAKEIIGSKTAEDIKANTKEAVDEAKEIFEEVKSRNIGSKIKGTFKDKLLSLNGRISNVDFFKQAVLLHVLLLIMAYFYRPRALEALIIYFIIYFIFYFFMLGKRLHDFGRSSFYGLLILILHYFAIPLSERAGLLYAFAVLAVLSYIPGDKNDNAYGSEDCTIVKPVTFAEDIVYFVQDLKVLVGKVKNKICANPKRAIGVGIVTSFILVFGIVISNSNDGGLYKINVKDIDGTWQSRGIFRQGTDSTVYIKERVSELAKMTQAMDFHHRLGGYRSRLTKEEIEQESRTLYLYSMELLPYDYNNLTMHHLNLKFNHLDPQRFEFYFLGNKAVLDNGNVILYKDVPRDVETVGNVHLGSELEKVVDYELFKGVKPVDMYDGKKVLKSKDKKIGVFFQSGIASQIYLYPNSKVSFDNKDVSVDDNMFSLMLKLGIPRRRTLDNYSVETYVLHEHRDSENLHVIHNNTTGEQSMLISQGDFIESWLMLYEDKVEDLFSKPLGYKLGSRYEDVRDDLLFVTLGDSGLRVYTCDDESKLNYFTLVPVGKVKVLDNRFIFNKTGEKLLEVNIDVEGEKEDIINHLLSLYGNYTYINQSGDDYLQLRWENDKNIIVYTYQHYRTGIVFNHISAANKMWFNSMP